MSLIFRSIWVGLVSFTKLVTCKQSNLRLRLVPRKSSLAFGWSGWPAVTRKSYPYPSLHSRSVCSSVVVTNFLKDRVMFPWCGSPWPGDPAWIATAAASLCGAGGSIAQPAWRRSPAPFPPAVALTVLILPNFPQSLKPTWIKYLAVIICVPVNIVVTERNIFLEPLEVLVDLVVHICARSSEDS